MKKENQYFNRHKIKFCHFCSSELQNKFINGHTSMYCIKCQIQIYQNPTPASCVVLFNKKGKVLLVKRKTEPKKGNWSLPGGFMEVGESPEETAIRELKEETGLIGNIDSLIGVSSNSKIGFYSIIVIGYLIKNFSGVLIPGDDALNTSFFNIKKMPQIAFESHIDFILSSS